MPALRVQISQVSSDFTVYTRVKRERIFHLLSMTGAEELVSVCNIKTGLRTKKEIIEAIKANDDLSFLSMTLIDELVRIVGTSTSIATYGWRTGQEDTYLVLQNKLKVESDGSMVQS